MGKAPLPAGPAYWRCIEPKVDNERPYHSRPIIPPPRIGQANTPGIATRRASPGESEGACITPARSPTRINHEYPAVAGIRESVHDILMNLKGTVPKSNSSAAREAYISLAGPGKVTAQDIVLPPSVGTIDPAQHTATITKKIHSNIGSRIERGCGYRRRSMIEYQNGNSPPDAVPMPIRNANHSIHRSESHHGGGMMKEMPPLEIRTNGSPTPEEAIHEAYRNSMNLFSSFPRDDG
uniref:RNA polymerase alpha subunit n=1 Tax=Selaginella sanguinolenta TaxID=493175 RepID=A0A650FHD0_9TRAC|nr:RNA polymerase alpha subunit [Selaginella sanguinolenta]